jgi:hypothetical protein
LNSHGAISSVYDSGYGVLSGTGIEGSWGVTGAHAFETGSISLLYSGDYRHYTNNLPSGTDHNLSFAFKKALSRRWRFYIDLSSGILLTGASYYVILPNQTNVLQTNPYSPTTKFVSGTTGLSYQASRRLSYQFGGGYSLSRYESPTPFGSNGVSTYGSVLYRTGRRTTVSANYTLVDYMYRYGAGDAQANTVYLGLAHDFGTRWELGLNGGISRASASGTIVAPPGFNQATGGGITFGHYDNVTYLPYFSASLSRLWRSSKLSAVVGQDVASGNGIYLASRNLHGYGAYSYTRGKGTLGASAGYGRLSSVANTVATAYTIKSASISYGYALLKYLGLVFRYDYINYDGLRDIPNGVNTDHRISFGVVFNSMQKVPVTLF